KDTPDFLQPDHRWLELQLRMLLEQVEQFENIVGFFWVIEWTADHGFHAHAVFWIDRQRVKKIYPFAERITECWRSITHNSGSAHRCTYQPHYTYNINIPVRHNDPESIDNIRGALHYLAKEEQKDGLCAYGCNEVPERPAAGRPRKPHF
ncbi:hypothetical protein, partial [Escherichia coli]